MADFVHLHLHTEYSLLDGACKLTTSDINVDNPDKTLVTTPLADALKELGMNACAITDHGNMYGAYTFVKTMRAAGIKPIVGQEFYYADDMYVKNPDVLKQRYHLILLAKNEVGYKNLMILSTKAFVDGFYMKPRIDLKLLREHSEGIICLSACLANKIPQLILHGAYEEAKQHAIELRDIFEPGDFYIELQNHDLPEDKIVTNQLVKIAREIGVKVVCTNDVHYIKKEDADIQDTMMCVNLQCKKAEINNARFTNSNFYLKSEEEMTEMFGWIPEALESTREIADKVDGDYFILKAAKTHIPKYENEEMHGRTTKQYLHDLAYERIHWRYPVITPEIQERLDYELGVIDDCGFNDYFLIVWDYVNAARLRGIPVGPGRGSGVGSIVAYSIGITDVDPLRYHLLFERFLCKERVSNPDFDIDFCFVRRTEVIDYCIEKYGKDNVSQIIAYSTMSAKAVVKDVARVYDVPYNEAAKWVKEIPTGKVLIKQVLTPGSANFSPDFLKIYESNATAKRVIDTAMKMEGMPRQTSMHAAGVVICGDPIVDYVALSRNGDVITTQFDKVIVEDIGLLKMDFLGLKTLTDISEAIKYIKEDRGVDIDFHKLGYEDKNVYDLIASGECEAVFQLEGGGMKRFMAQLQPTTLEDVMAGISMYRPGPMQFLDLFLEGKRHPENVKYLHPLLKPILDNTYGCIVYQEQVMQIAQKIAGYSFGGADIMRRGIAKKDLEKLKKQKEIFLHGGVLEGDKTHKQIPGAIANGVSEEVASELFEQILKFASYAFNKSHAAAYTYVSYQTAYLKCYYPVHYITAVINNRITNADETKHYINYLKRSGTNILKPDINKSKQLFSIEGKDVRYGLMGIKGVGEQAIDLILNERKENGNFKDIRDFFERCSVQLNKRMVESLIKGGALDCFGKNRATLMASYEQILDAVTSDRKNKMSGQLSLFDGLLEDIEIKYIELPEYSKQQILRNEKEVLGMYISGHPLDEYSEEGQGFNFDTSMLYVEETDENGESVTVINQDLNNKLVRFGGMVANFDKKITGKGQKFAVGLIEDKNGSIGFSMYPKNYEKYGEILEHENPILITGRIDLRDETEAKISIDKIQDWTNGSSEDGSGPANDILYIKFDSNKEYSMVISTLQLFEGTTPVHGQIVKNGKPIVVDTHCRVEVSDELMRRLKLMLGEGKIKYIKK